MATDEAKGKALEAPAAAPGGGGRGWSAFAVLLQHDLGRTLRRKQVIVLGVLLALPLAISIAALVDGSKVLWGDLARMVGIIYAPLLLPLVAMFQGGPLVVEDAEQHTLQYLLVRPVARWQIFASKIAAGTSGTIALLIASLVLFAGVQSPLLTGADQAVSSILRVASAVALGSAAYVSLFGALASISGRSMLAGVIYFVVEWVLSRLPILELISIRFHLNRVLEFTPERSPTEMMLPEGMMLEPWASALALGGAAIVLLAIGALAAELRQYRD